jgi:hypothetical protein
MISSIFTGFLIALADSSFGFKNLVGVIRKGQFQKGRKKGPKGIFRIPLEPSYQIILENPFHNPPNRLRWIAFSTL